MKKSDYKDFITDGWIWIATVNVLLLPLVVLSIIPALYGEYITLALGIICLVVYGVLMYAMIDSMIDNYKEMRECEE